MSVANTIHGRHLFDGVATVGESQSRLHFPWIRERSLTHAMQFQLIWCCSLGEVSPNICVRMLEHKLYDWPLSEANSLMFDVHCIQPPESSIVGVLIMS